MFTCEECGKEFERKYNMQRHVNSQHKKIKLECAYCGELTPTKEKMAYHMVRHGFGMAHKCQLCDYETVRGYTFKKHERVHWETEQVECNECGRAFKDRDTLRVHKGIHEGVSYECNFCDYSATQKARLRTHTASLHGDTRYKCHLCQEMFTRKDHLKAHINIVHMGKNTFSCDICNFCCQYNYNLKRHMKDKHPKEKLKNKDKTKKMT